MIEAKKSFLSSYLVKICILPMFLSGVIGSAWGVDETSSEDAVTDEGVVESPPRRGAAAILMEEVVTSARKKSVGEEVQDVPIAMTAYSGEQLEVMQTRDLVDMTFSMPNVALDGSTTQKGTANFSVRGLAVSGSVPSVDPTVGVFIDGMYLGMIWGVVQDTFDLERMEVLRGPQGLLFGRNVTGGAVTMRTRRPSHEFDMRAKTSVTDDNDQVYAFSTTGSLIEDVLAAKLSVYYRDDNGYFDNRATNNSHFGESETYMIRPAFTWTPTEDLELTFLYERGEIEGDGSVGRNIYDPTLGKFETDNDFEGNTKARWNSIIWETNYDVSFGDGTITNIVAYRDFEQRSGSDADGSNSPVTGFEFHLADSLADQDQFSNELRYAGTFMNDKLDLTVGTFYFTQNQSYVEHREFALGRALSIFGGSVDHKTWAVFTQGDYQLTDALTLTLGARYSYEEKEAEIARGKTGTAPCRIEPSLHCNADFFDDDDWNSFTPKFGLQWFFSDTAHSYFTYTKGFRSGGYNVRSNGVNNSPGPYDQETQDAYEIGLKSEWLDGRIKFNIALFQNEIKDLQRTSVFPTDDGTGNTVQEIRNTADATIRGGEVELSALVTDNLILRASVGYLDGQFDKVSSDLNRDGVINSEDKALDLPRLAPWSWQVGANYDMYFDHGSVSMHANYNHRDISAQNDSNTDFISSADMLNAGISFTTLDGKWTASLFGKNLLDDRVNTSRTTIVPGRYSLNPIQKGRVIGAELKYQY